MFFSFQAFLFQRSKINFKVLIAFSYLVLFFILGCSPQPDAIIRVDCGEFNNKGVQASLNGQFIGECPVDLTVHSGKIEINARKDNDDASYLYAEAKMTLAENAMKRIKLDVQPVYTEEYYYLKSTDIAGMELYLNKQPDGKRRGEIAEKIENYYFEKAKDLVGLNIYLEKAPLGTYKDEVQKRVDSILEQQRLGKEKELEKKRNEALAAAAKKKEIESKAKEQQESTLYASANTFDGMKAYLHQAPIGKYKNEIDKKLTELRKIQNSNVPVMERIPGGTFSMGCIIKDEKCHDSEKPNRQVTISEFKLSKTEVTIGQFKAFIASAKRDDLMTAHFPYRNKQGDTVAVTGISWQDANDYISWLNKNYGGGFRLPSEAEWEYACRGGKSQTYCGSDYLADVGWFDTDVKKPVALKKPNAFGVFDMSGNAQEWVQDCYSKNYAAGSNNGRPLEKGECGYRILRGGAWYWGAGMSRASTRDAKEIDERNYYVGFRVAQDF